MWDYPEDETEYSDADLGLTEDYRRLLDEEEDNDTDPR